MTFPINYLYPLTKNTDARLLTLEDIANGPNQPYDVRLYGADPTGATDSTAAITAAIAAAYAAGGGVIDCPAGTYRILGQLAMPFGAGAVGKTTPLFIRGNGALFSNLGDVDPINGGTVFDMRSTTAPAKIDTRGLGLLKFEGITFTSGLAGDTNPFIQTTNTTLKVQDCAFVGDTTVNGQSCVQDAIVLGGTSTSIGMTSNAPFQGYGTEIKGNYFHHIRRGVFGRTFTNSVLVLRNNFAVSCGAADATSAAIDFVGLTTPNFDEGNVIRDNLIEVTYYPYGVKLTNSRANIVDGNSFWDGGGAIGLGCILLDVGATENVCIAAFNGQSGSGGGSLFVVENAAVTGKNLSLSTNVADQMMQLPGSLRLPAGDLTLTSGNLHLSAGALTVASAGATITGAVFVTGAFQLATGFGMQADYFTTQANGGPYLDMTTANQITVAARGPAPKLVVNTTLNVVGNAGFNGTAPIAKPTVSGSRGGNAALASLLTALANYGLITDSTSA